MKVILSNMCLSLVGMLKPELGYFLVKRGDSFFSQRSGHGAPPDGHWRFIVLCAELAQNKLHISDIEVTNHELFEALREANLPSPAFLNWYNVVIYNAAKVLQLKSELGL